MYDEANQRDDRNGSLHWAILKNPSDATVRRIIKENDVVQSAIQPKNIRRDEVDYLPEDGVYCFRCFWWCLFLHNPVGYRITPPVLTLNIHPIANAMSEWDANDSYQIAYEDFRYV